MASDDVIMAFFPCTRFEVQILLPFRGEAYQQKNWPDLKKLEYSMKLHDELARNYELVSKLVGIALKRGLRMILENPFDEQHYLKRYWPIKPKIIDRDRTVDGDYYKKPTQYWFIGFEPKQNLVFEPIEYVPRKSIARQTNENGLSRETLRSMIHPQYASRFIRKYILEEI